MRNVRAGYKDIVKRWVVTVISSMKSLPKRSDVPPERPHPAESTVRGASYETFS